jgi:predicted transcriptional regulator
MLAVVKKPHIELSINGENVNELIKWISKKFDIEIVNTADNENELISINDSQFYKDFAKNKRGNLLAGYRLKANLTQKQLADKIGITQNMVSDYEKGKREFSKDMINRFKQVLDIPVAF